MLPPLHTLGMLALKIGCQVHHLQRLCDRNLIPFVMVGRNRVIADGDVPAVIEACRRAGYLRGEPAAAAG